MLVLHWANILAQGRAGVVTGTAVQQQEDSYARNDARRWLLARAEPPRPRRLRRYYLGQHTGR